MNRKNISTKLKVSRTTSPCLFSMVENRQYELSQVQSENITLNQTRSLLQAEIDRLQSSYDRISKEKEELTVNFHTIESEVKLLRDQRKVFEGNQADLERKLADVTAENARLQVFL